jgi:hypothetical protein
MTYPPAIIRPTRYGLVASEASSSIRALSSTPPPPGPPESPPPPKPANSSSNTGRFFSAGAGILATGSLLLGKTKYLLAALKVTKLASLGSMILSIGAYSMLFGFPYAVGVVGQIFLHESGHAYAMHRLGVPFSPMVFIPFMGAVIAMKEQPRDAYQDAIIGAAGPVAGTLAAGAISIVGHLNGGSQLLIALADFGFMINLFNLLPIGNMYVTPLFFFSCQFIRIVVYTCLYFGCDVLANMFFLPTGQGRRSLGRRPFTVRWSGWNWNW